MFVCDIYTKLGAPVEYSLPGEYVLADLDYIIVDYNMTSVFTCGFKKKLSYKLPTSQLFADILMAFQIKENPTDAVSNAFTVDANRQKLLITTESVNHVVKFSDSILIKEFPMLMAIFNQVSCVPLLRAITRYINYFLGDNVVLLDGRMPLQFQLIPKYSTSAKTLDDILLADSFTEIVITKTMKIFSLETEPIEIGTCKMKLQIMYNYTINEVSFFGDNVKFSYKIKLR